LDKFFVLKSVLFVILEYNGLILKNNNKINILKILVNINIFYDKKNIKSK
tara:strand:- start:235 stop:384 length:150 start_codon:yes stop_codon:yes gene_type:complete